MELDEARAVLAQIGAGEDSTAEEVYYGANARWGRDEGAPLPQTALAALDTLRAAREEKLMDDLHEAEVTAGRLLVVEFHLKGLVRRLADELKRQECEFRGNDIVCHECSQYTEDGCGLNCDALLEEARQALGEEP